MDMVLVLVTALSLAIAIAMGVVVVGMLREDRRRSEARVAALMEMADRRPDVQRADAQRANVQRADVARSEIPRSEAPRSDVARTHVAPSHIARPHVTRPHVARGPADAADVELRRPEVVSVAGVGDLFAEPDRSSPWTSRLAVAAMLALVVGGGGYLFLRGGGAPARAEGTNAAAAPSATAPLELVSLSHTQQPASLTVSGLVQNPAAGGVRTRVVATAFVFGDDGAFLGSGRAPLDFTTLSPGDESPFVVTVPVSGRVARYRIGFRTEDGSVIAHVDKRQADAVAMK
jgi:hypothetical protein